MSHSSGAFHTLETSVAPDGAFSFTNVVPGNYSGQLVAPGIRGAVVPVVITETNLSEIQITAPREVRGRVIADGSSPIPRFSIPLIAGRDETIVTVDPQTDGAFTVFLPAGEHRTGTPLGLPSGYSIQSLSYGSVDLLREPLKVSSDNSSELLIRQKIDEFQSAIVPKLGDKGPRFSQGPSFDPGNPSHGTEFLPAPQHSAS